MLRQRDYPKSLVVGDAVWEVKFVRSLGDDPKHYIVGQACPEEQTIYIRQKLDAQERLETFLHELLHAIEYELDVAIPHPVVYALDKALAALLVENFVPLLAVITGRKIPLRAHGRKYQAMATTRAK